MPTYLYKRKDGSIIERTMTISQMGDVQMSDAHGDYILDDDGKRAYRNMALEQKGATHATGWATGLVSEAAGCSVDNIPAERIFNQKHGINPDYTKDGAVIFTSRGQRKKFNKAHGLIDKSGGYGD